MDLAHSFTVPVDVDTAWAEFQDITSVAECFPGAALTSVEGDTFTGSVKVKLGPIALVYNGSGTFTEKDESAHRFVVDAKGKDKRGNGTAGATVTLTMDGSGDSTDVKVHTDLAITGKPAQFGRGVMQDVSDKLLGQFVACLEQRLTDSARGAFASTAEAAAPPVAALDADLAAEAEPVESAAPAEAPREPAAPAPAISRASSSHPARLNSSSSRGPGDSLDLGRTVLPVLARAYWKQALVALAVIVVVIWLIAR
jgi:carbon monoxide dehydrogenase subunit G